MTQDQDQELVRRVANGDELALRTLFARHATRTFRYVLGLVRNEAVAEEVTNEAFLEVWRHAGNYRRGSAFSTWLIAIARNKALSRLRKRHDDLLSEGLAEAQPDPSDNPEIIAIKRSKAEAIRDCLGRLSDAHREIIDIVYYHEKSVAEASEILGIPQNTVKTRMFHARRQLSELLREAGIDRGWP